MALAVLHSFHAEAERSLANGDTDSREKHHDYDAQRACPALFDFEFPIIDFRWPLSLIPSSIFHLPSSILNYRTRTTKSTVRIRLWWRN